MKRTDNTAGKGRAVDWSREIRKEKTAYSLEDILCKELQLIKASALQTFNAYKQIVSSVNNTTLRDLLSNYLTGMAAELNRLQKIAETSTIDLSVEVPCTAIQNHLKNLTAISSEYPKGLIKDILLIIHTKKIEYTGVSAYRSICELCETLGYYKMGEILDNSLAEKENMCRELIELLKRLTEEAAKESVFAEIQNGEI